MLNSVLKETFSLGTFIICLFSSLLLGSVLALIHKRYNSSSKGFIITLAILPAIVLMVIIMVNGNLGTGVAVMGAFSLVRFRSIPGNAREINSIFQAMAVGLATGMGYLAAAGVFVLVICGISILYNITGFGESKHRMKELKITIPESLDYSGVFDDLFEKYLKSQELIQVKTSGMGSLYKLTYRITFRNPALEKALIDDLRCRNGNLEITCGRVAYNSEEL